MKNQVQLITYADRLAGGGLSELSALLRGPLAGVFGGVHVLPFFHPIDGADAGFDPIDHSCVDAQLGGWADIRALSQHIDVMADVIVNHMSVHSPQFLDWSEKGAASEFAGLFLTYDKVFPQGATEGNLLNIYRPRPGLPFTHVTLRNGEHRLLWTTFTPQQVDIDVHSPAGQQYLQGILRTFSANGIRMVRLDAVGYAIKRAGSACFMMPETFAFIDEFARQARALGMEVLVEVHSHHRQQVEIAQRVDWVYDFALPPLVLHAFAFKTAERLKHWLRIRPDNALTVLDTHDGIGIIDIGSAAADRAANPGLVPDDELSRLVDWIHSNSRDQSREATGAAASNVDLYQVNCTFLDALGGDERAYLLSRAIQFFVPGIPQVYYVGLLAGANDMDALRRTRVGRDINRRRYAKGEAERELDRPVVQALLGLIRWRNEHAAFAGRFTLQASDAQTLAMRWTNGDAFAEFSVDFASHAFTLSCSGEQPAPSLAVQESC